MRYAVFNLVLFVFLAVGAEAVIVAGGDGTQNTTSPDGGQGWDYVGRIDKGVVSSSVTYIYNNWFITAHHVKALDNPTGVLLNGSSYLIDPNSWTRLSNSEGDDADLSMFRVVGGTVGLAGLTVRSSATSNDSGLTMIGNGRNRETSETRWRSTWAETTSSRFEYSGYKWAEGATKRWGTNDKEDDVVELISIGFGATDAFYTDFDDADDEAQGATYDSGGGVFYDNEGNWELAGIMIAIGTYSGQTNIANSALYGNVTYIADMQYYASQISSTALIIDLDEDGIPDEWEYAQSGSTIGVVASADQDDDGFTGEEEWLADTDPNNSNSFLRVMEYTNATSLVFSSSTNRKYEVQYATDLTNSMWATEVAWFDGSNGQTTQSVSTSTSNRFYRVRAKLQ